eukprot:2197522-Rhodomonas_salina.4
MSPRYHSPQHPPPTSSFFCIVPRQANAKAFRGPIREGAVLVVFAVDDHQPCGPQHGHLADRPRVPPCVFLWR